MKATLGDPDGLSQLLESWSGIIRRNGTDGVMPFLKKVKEKTEDAAKKTVEVGKDVGEKGVDVGKKGVDVGKKGVNKTDEAVRGKDE